MAHLSREEVQIVCACGSIKPVTKVFLCRYCVLLRCGFCVSHEVDAIYCSNCLENLASSEARLKNNRCGSCFSCPCCFHILTIRACPVIRNLESGGTPVKASNADSTTGTPSKTTMKNYYLSCFFCRWTSRDAKIPDQPSSNSNNWPVHEQEHATRISSLIEYYKMIMLREKLEKENRIFLYSSRRGYQHFSEKFGLTAMIARKRAGLPPLSLGRDEMAAAPQVTAAVASEDVAPLPADIFDKPVDISRITSLPQRFVIPDYQPETLDDLFPVHKQLSIKRSLRCKACMHNIFKPEYGPASIKFKIRATAYLYIPEIRLMKKISPKCGQREELLVKVINPAQNVTNIRFLQLDEVPIVQEKSVEKDIDRSSDIVESVTEGSLITVSRKSYPAEKPRPLVIKTNAIIDFPPDIINLPNDNSAEFDENNDANQHQDNPAFVIWRKGNKVILKFYVTPDEALLPNDEIRVGFVLRFSYRDKGIDPLEQKESKDVDINVRHYLNIGTIG